MRRLAPLLLVLLAAACAPAPSAVLTPGEELAITVTATEPLFDVTLSIANAWTTDARCIVIRDVDVGCSLGDLAEGDSVTVRATSHDPGNNYCLLAGFGEEGNLATYRPFPCEIRR